jgi:hypothetical protein
VRAATRVNIEQAPKKSMWDRPAILTGKAAVVGEASEKRSRRSHRGSDGSTHGHEQCATREVCGRGKNRQLRANGEPARASVGERRWRMGS